MAAPIGFSKETPKKQKQAKVVKETKNNNSKPKEENIMAKTETAVAEAKDTIIRIPACITKAANKTVNTVLPELITKHLPGAVKEAKLKVAVPAAGVAGYLVYRMLSKVFGKTKAPKA